MARLCYGPLVPLNPCSAQQQLLHCTLVQLLSTAVYIVTDHCSGLGRAIGRLCGCPDEMTFDLDIGHGGST